MQVILHIGTHKTGSTSFQAYCNHNQKRLMKDGIYWPEKFPYDNESHTAHTLISNAIRAGKTNIVKTFIQQSLQKAGENNCSKLVISGESFCSMSSSDIKAFLAIFPEECQIKIIVFYRNVYDYIRSALSQKLKKPETLLNTHSMMNVFSNALNYKKQMINWGSAVPEENIHVFSYDQYKNKLLEHMFESIAHVSVNQSYLAKSKRVYANVSPDIGTLLHWSLAGLVPNPVDYKIMNTLYKTAYKGQPKVITPVECLFTKYMVDGLNLDFDHPKLLPLCPYLLAVPNPANLTQEQRLDYMARQAKVFKRASRPINILLSFWQRLKKFTRRQFRSLF